MCEHTVAKNGWDHIDPSDPEIPKPKTPDELLAEKKRRGSKEYMGFINDLIK